MTDRRDRLAFTHEVGSWLDSLTTRTKTDRLDRVLARLYALQHQDGVPDGRIAFDRGNGLGALTVFPDGEKTPVTITYYAYDHDGLKCINFLTIETGAADKLSDKQTERAQRWKKELEKNDNDPRRR